ncbi:helix-turn-helix domain-containing protein [Microcoleus sp. FACHB-53]|nr:helix-turn-helix domain-containing protein [Microcoleus sp. FACHB-53]
MVTEVYSLRYLVERRIEGAKILRSQTDLSVAQIATRVGFATPSHFTSVFRKHLKTTPNTQHL